MTNPGRDITDSISDSASRLHHLFGTLFPSSASIKTGGRVKGLQFIAHHGPIDWNSQKDRLYEEFDVGSRQGLRNTLEALEEERLITWNNGLIKATEEGHRTVEGLQEFVDQFSGEGRSNKGTSEFTSPHYEHATAKVYTNGEDYADYLWTWTLSNKNGNEDIESIEYMCESGGSEIGELDITYSQIIDEHEITVDKPDTRYFRLHFAEPIKPDETVQYWYSYRLPSNLHPDWAPFRYSYHCRTYPVATLELNIINDKRFEIDDNSLRSNIELGDRSTIPHRTEQSELRIERMKELSYINYSARYVPLGTTLTLFWDFNYSQV